MAHLVAEVLSPIHVAAAMDLVVAWRATHALVPALAWGGLTALFSAVAPAAFIHWGIRRGRYDDHHLSDRAARPFALAVVVGSVLVGLGALLLLDGPRMLVALVVAQVVGVAVAGLVSLVWKVSLHSAVSWGSVAVLVLAFGPWLALSGLLAAVISWSRVVLRAHTVGQVVVGGLVGVLVAGSFFAWLR